MKDQELNVFGEPDDIKQALYSSWADAEDALCKLQLVMGVYSVAGTEVGDALAEVHDALIDCRDSVKAFAPNYYSKTMEDWAQAAAEMSHP